MEKEGWPAHVIERAPSVIPDIYPRERAFQLLFDSIATDLLPNGLWHCIQCTWLHQSYPSLSGILASLPLAQR
jgi:hypothetical protein